MSWREQNHSVLAARFGEKAVIGRRVLVGATSQPVGGSVWREGSYLETCWWEQNHSVFGGSLWREGSRRETFM